MRSNRGTIFAQTKEVEIEIYTGCDEWKYIGIINNKHCYRRGNVTIKLNTEMNEKIFNMR